MDASNEWAPAGVKDALVLAQALQRHALVVDVRTGHVAGCTAVLAELGIAPLGERAADDGVPLEQVEIVNPAWARDRWGVEEIVRLDDRGLALLMMCPLPRAPVQLKLLGGFSVRGPDGTIYAEGPERSNPWECLLLIAAHGDSPVSRAEIGRALWPHDSTGRQKDNLKQALRRLRKRHEEVRGVDVEMVRALPGGMLTLNRDEVSFDVGEVLEVRRRMTELLVHGDEEAAVQLAAAVFCTLFDEGPTGRARSIQADDVEATPALAPLVEAYEGAVAHFAGVLAERIAPPARSWEIIRRCLFAVPDSPDVTLTAVRVALHTHGEALARWVYEDLYLPRVAKSAPLEFGEILRFAQEAEQQEAGHGR